MDTLYSDKRLPRPCQNFAVFALGNTCKVLRGYPPAVKEQVACASTEPGDSPAPSRTGESSELGEVFDQANLLQRKDSWNFEVARAINVQDPGSE